MTTNNSINLHILYCVLCSTEITTRGAKKYCSRNCFETTKFGNNNRLGKKLSIETKKRISNKVTILWQDTVYAEKMRISHLGHKAWNKGLQGFRAGESSHLWKGGITEERKELNYYRELRRKRLYESIGSHSLEEWMKLKKLHLNRCLSCNKSEPEIKLSRDHVIPLSKGGSDFISNIQPLCRSCNSKKHDKTIDYRKELTNV